MTAQMRVSQQPLCRLAITAVSVQACATDYCTYHRTDIVSTLERYQRLPVPSSAVILDAPYCIRAGPLAPPIRIGLAAVPDATGCCQPFGAWWHTTSG
ncbi:hypothetical protein BU16DRAFT_274063 [Lophium mytilinum]|uniref:Uncharacterized protein n=1 Tax=Lophium mytilinum TaxID=390894 RepID=A0A6A6R4Q2_9PEZI|nr:hypothetical protein BU16DRAFT_274063 [Lophium mytilinum]